MARATAQASAARGAGRSPVVGERIPATVQLQSARPAQAELGSSAKDGALRGDELTVGQEPVLLEPAKTVERLRDGLPRVNGRNPAFELALGGVRAAATKAFDREASPAGRLHRQRAPDEAPVERDLRDVLVADGGGAGTRDEPRLRVLDPMAVDADPFGPEREQPRLTHRVRHLSTESVRRLPCPAAPYARGSDRRSPSPASSGLQTPWSEAAWVSAGAAGAAAEAGAEEEAAVEAAVAEAAVAEAAGAESERVAWEP